MSLTRAQIILLQRAKSQAALSDPDYRDAIQTISGLPGCRSSKDPRLTDRHLDNLMAYFEAIFWHQVDAGQLHLEQGASVPFKTRSFWSSRNPKANTSRDRYAADQVATQINRLEQRLAELGFGLHYCATIRARITPFSPRAYIAALERTLRSKTRAAMAAQENTPF